MAAVRSIEVLSPGLQTTIQDLGRYGYGHYGVPASGALDFFSLRIANRLVDNPEDSACLETTLMGLRFKALTDVCVAVTGAAGQIGYQLSFRIASGQMLGSDQPVILQLLEIPPALPALNGVVMELDDCAFPTLAGIVATDDPNVAFKDSDYALLVGARPRGDGGAAARGGP